MAAETEVVARYGDHFAALETHLGPATDSPLHQRRREAWQRFAAMGFPHSRDEDWRLTRLTSLARSEFAPSAHSGAAAARPATGAAELDGPSLVFVDGVLAPALSRPAAPEGVRVTELAPTLATRPELLAELGQHATEAQQPFTALNTAFLSSGALVEVAAGSRLAEPKTGGEMIRSVSFDKTTFNELPHKFEAGTPHIAGGIAMEAAVDYVNALGRARIEAYEAQLLAYGTEALSQVPGLRLLGTAASKVGVLSFTLDAAHPHDIGTILDTEGIAIRTGHHCAQPVMQRFGVPATARASLAFYNTREELDALASALRKVNEVFR